ncbi:hypothetical protein HN011_002454 [Eciton burchellii]|nr:hypothetical protein HN011_002454 [Eciton burchellii]
MTNAKSDNRDAYPSRCGTLFRSVLRHVRDKTEQGKEESKKSKTRNPQKSRTAQHAARSPTTERNSWRDGVTTIRFSSTYVMLGPFQPWLEKREARIEKRNGYAILHRRLS